VTLNAPSAQFYGYPPVRGQWVRTHYQVGDNVTYADPPQLQEMRERGARLYCAARTANKAQTGHTVTMGSQAIASVNIRGNQIDLLVVEPTVEIGGPTMQMGTSFDGAQAFEVPFQFGTILTPIRGLGLPGLPEIRYPVALTTGDTEAITDAEWEQYPSIIQQWDVTASHADTIRSAGMNVTATKTVTLLSLYLLNLELNTTLTFGVGTPSTQNARLLEGNLIGLPEATRTGTIDSSLGVTYNDGPWWTCWGTGCTSVLPSSAPWSLPEPSTGPASTRAWQDDDHNFRLFRRICGRTRRVNDAGSGYRARPA